MKTKENTTEVEVITKTDIIPEQPKGVQESSIDTLISQALTSNAPIEVMERFFALKERAMAIQAKQAFDEAMANAQGEFPIIRKNKEGGRTQSGVVAYKYAPIEDIVEQVSPVLSKHGLSSSFKTEIGTDKVKVTCIAKHKLGHSESSEMELPFGTKTNVMSAPQVVVATVTFAKRYTFCNVFGITVGGEDTDAKDLPKDDKAIPTSVLEEVENATTEEELKTIWEKHKGLGKEFGRIVVAQKKFIQSVTNDENATA